MKRKLFLASLVIVPVTLAGISTAGFGDDDSAEYRSRKPVKVMPGIAPVESSLYREECGSCHFPYQPGLLPGRSWSKLIVGLNDHFGENAELPADDAVAIRDYLVANSADHSNYRRSMKIVMSLKFGDTPLRISKTPYFVKEHDELSRRMVEDNPEVGSFSKCDACHTRADTGSFNEREIRVPGFGVWEDD